MRSEDQARGADDVHGDGGEWRVEEMRLRWEILEAFRDAAAEIGIPRTDDFHRGDNEGCGYFQVSQRRGVRCSSAKAFLRPATGPTTPTELTGAQDMRPDVRGSRPAGVQFQRTAAA